jgi:hypothetical protein
MEQEQVNIIHHKLWAGKIKAVPLKLYTLYQPTSAQMKK